MHDYNSGPDPPNSPGPAENATIASLNRNAFNRARVLSVNVAGGPGSGKSTLIIQTIARLLPQWQAGVIAANSIFNPDIARFDAVAAQTAKLQFSTASSLMPHDIQDGLSQLDLAPLGAVFIENLDLPPGEFDLGEELRVVVFSVAARADTASGHPEVVKWADAVILNKVDLLGVAAFDLESFRYDIHRLNPRAKLFEISASKGDQLDDWARWVRRQIHKRAGS